MSAKKTIARIAITVQERDIIMAAVEKYVATDATRATQYHYIRADLNPLCAVALSIILSYGNRGLHMIHDALFVFHGSTEPLTLRIAKAMQPLDEPSQDNILVVFVCND